MLNELTWLIFCSRLGKRSCTEYRHEERKGFIKYWNDPLKMDYMFKKKIKMLICDCDLAMFLVTDEGEVRQKLLLCKNV